MTTHRIAALLLALIFAGNVQAATWYVYVEPDTYCSTVRTKDMTNPATLREKFDLEDFEDAIRHASEGVEQHANWKLVPTRDKGKATIKVRSAPLHVVYLDEAGRRVKGHVAGQWLQDSKTVRVHNGYIAADTNPYGNYVFWSDFTPTIEALAGLILHEIGHHNSLLGRSHDYNMTKAMRSGDSYEARFIRAKFGAPIPKPVPESEAPPDPKPDPKTNPPQWTGLFENQLWGKWAPDTWLDARSGDFNGDGKDDIVGRRPNGDIWVMLSDDGKLRPERWSKWKGDAPWQHVVVGDFNGDGRDDLAGNVDGDWWVGISRGTTFHQQSRSISDPEEVLRTEELDTVRP